MLPPAAPLPPCRPPALAAARGGSETTARAGLIQRDERRCKLVQKLDERRCKLNILLYINFYIFNI